MSEALREELQAALERLHVEACRVETYAELLRDAAHSLQSDARAAQERLANDPEPKADDIHADNANELGSMTYEIGRLQDVLSRMRGDCGAL